MSTPLALGSGINHVKRKGKMKCTECGLALKREGIKGEKRKGKSRGSLSFLSLSNLLFFPSLPSTLDACPRRLVSQGYKRSNTWQEREPSMESPHVNDLRWCVAKIQAVSKQILSHMHSLLKPSRDGEQKHTRCTDNSVVRVQQQNTFLLWETEPRGWRRQRWCMVCKI